MRHEETRAHIRVVRRLAGRGAPGSSPVPTASSSLPHLNSSPIQPPYQPPHYDPSSPDPHSPPQLGSIHEEDVLPALSSPGPVLSSPGPWLPNPTTPYAPARSLSSQSQTIDKEDDSEAPALFGSGLLFSSPGPRLPDDDPNMIYDDWGHLDQLGTEMADDSDFDFEEAEDDMSADHIKAFLSRLSNDDGDEDAGGPALPYMRSTGQLPPTRPDSPMSTSDGHAIPEDPTTWEPWSEKLVRSSHLSLDSKL